MFFIANCIAKWNSKETETVEPALIRTLSVKYDHLPVNTPLSLYWHCHCHAFNDIHNERDDDGDYQNHQLDKRVERCNGWRQLQYWGGCKCAPSVQGVQNGCGDDRWWLSDRMSPSDNGCCLYPSPTSTTCRLRDRWLYGIWNAVVQVLYIASLCL